jgi:hypothetical protein
LASIEIHSVQSISGNQPRIRRMAEKAGQVFLAGTPLFVDATGFVLAVVTPATTAVPFAGFSKSFGANLAASGVSQQQTFSSVPNQPSAVNIARPFFNDGLTDFETGAQDTVFLGQVGPAQTALVTDLGTTAGLTKDADNHWFVDKTAAGANKVVMIVKLDPNDQSATPRGVYFTVLPAAWQSLV